MSIRQAGCLVLGKMPVRVSLPKGGCGEVSPQPSPSGSISSMFRIARSPSALTWILLIVISLETGDDSHRLQLLPGS